MKVRFIKKRLKQHGLSSFGPQRDQYGNLNSYCAREKRRSRRWKKEQRFKPYDSLIRRRDIAAGSITINKIGTPAGWGISYYASR